MNKKIISSFIFLQFILISLFIYSFLNRNLVTYGFLAPDETINYAFAKFQKDEGHPFTTTNLNTLTNSTIFKPRGTILSDEKVLPRKFLGYPLIIGSVSRVFNFEVSPYLNLVIFILLLCVIREIFKAMRVQRSWFYATVLVLAPPIIYWTHNYFFESILALLFFSLGLLFTIQIPNTKKKELVNLLGAVLFFSLGIYVRYDYLLFYIPLIILSTIIFKPSLKNISIAIVFLFICIVPLLITNNNLYGNPLSSGQSSQIENRSPIVKGGKSSAAFKTNIKIILGAASYYLLPFIFTIQSMPTLKDKIKGDKQLLLLVLFFIFGFILFSQFWLSGVVRNTNNYLRESYNRYFLPLYLTLLLICLKTISQKKLSVKIQLIMVMISLASILQVTRVIKNEDKIRLRQARQAELIMDNTEVNSIVYIGNLDKIIYPHREVGYVGNIPIEDFYPKLTEFITLVNQTDRPQYLYDCTYLEQSLIENFSSRDINIENVANCLYAFSLK